MEWSNRIKEVVNGVMERELDAINWEQEYEGGNDMFAIVPSIAFTTSGEPFPVYGIVNRDTLIREADTGQYSTAKDYVAALSAQAKGQKLPGLGGVRAEPVQAPTRGNSPKED